MTRELSFRLHAKSATLALAYAQADALVSPTRFQASLLPCRLGRDVHILHEGVATDRIRPRLDAAFTLDDGRVLDRSTPIVTFVSRTLEPMRGFHIVMRALPAILGRNLQAQVLMIGDAERSGYGAPPPGGGVWKQRMLQEVGGELDLTRVHFTGSLSYARYLDALAVSAAHIYLTYPFTLSWSLLEAMASGCLVVASRTPPVLEVLDERSALMVDFFDQDGLINAVEQGLQGGPKTTILRQAARSVAVARFDREQICLPGWLELIDKLLGS